MSNREKNLPHLLTFQFPITTSGTPEQLQVKRRAATIAFNENNASADTITDSGNGFLIAGFQPGDSITVSGSALNDGTYVIAAVTAGTITIRGNQDLTTEAAGATVKIVASKTIPDGIGVTIKAAYANTGTICMGHSTESALNTTTGNFKLRNNESLSLQVNSTDAIWLDATVSGELVEVFFEKNVQA